MPAGATTSTNQAPRGASEPIGYLSVVFPGAGSLNLDPAATRLRDRARVCEQVWLEPELFDHDCELILATLEENYQQIAASNEDPRPGSLGEQLLLRNVDLPQLKPSVRLGMADAVLRVEKTENLEVQRGDATVAFTVIHLSIEEPGLVEPGAPLFVV